MNPFMAFCLYVASRVFVQFLKKNPQDQEIRASLEFLLTAMSALRRKNPLTESFMVQLNLDIEGSGLDIMLHNPDFTSLAKSYHVCEGDRTPSVKFINMSLGIFQPHTKQSKHILPTPSIQIARRQQPRRLSIRRPATRQCSRHRLANPNHRLHPRRIPPPSPLRPRQHPTASHARPKNHHLFHLSNGVHHHASRPPRRLPKRQLGQHLPRRRRPRRHEPHPKQQHQPQPLRHRHVRRYQPIHLHGPDPRILQHQPFRH